MVNFDQGPPLASDSEWLLLSGQTNVAALAEGLTREHYRLVYQLAWLLAGEPPAARDCAVQALAQAIRQAWSYPVATGVRAWLAGFVIQVCSSVQVVARLEQRSGLPAAGLEPAFWNVLSEFNPDERLAFILKAVFEFPIAEVAKICHQDSSDLEQNFTLIYRRIQTELQPAIPDVPSRQIDELLKEYANRRWPVVEASEQDLQRTAQAVAELVSKQNSARQRRSVLLEIAGIGLALIAIFITVQFSETILPSASAPSPAAGLPAPSLPWSPKVYYQVQPGDSLESIARKTGVTLAELSSMNAISSTLDLYEGQELAISVPGIREVSAGLPQADLTPTVQPLTLESGPAEIRKRLSASSRYWTSLWMDTQEASGSLEPSMTNGTEYLRRQIWIQQPDRSYEITNYLRGSDAMDYYRAIVFKGQGYYAFGSNSPFFWDGDWRIPPGELLYNPYLQEMVFPGQSSLVAVDRRYQVVRQSEVAGRKVLLVDTWRPGDEFQRRIWVDVQTGLILRYQVEFPDYKGQKDFIVTALAYNIPIPPALFDPRQPKSGGFAMDYSGWAPAPDLLRATDTPAFSLAPSPTP